MKKLYTAFLLVLLAALPLILNLYTLSPASRELATQLIFIHDGFAMLLWPLALSMPNALRAANDVKFTMVLSIGSMICFRIALSYIVGVKMGYKDSQGRGGVFLKASVLHDWEGDAKFRYSKGANVSRTLTESLGGTWYEYGLGADYNATDQVHLYADLEAGNGGEVDTDYRFNVGVINNIY